MSGAWQPIPDCDYYTCDPGGEGYESDSVMGAIDVWEEEFGASGGWDDVLVFGFNGTPDGEHTVVGHWFGAPVRGLLYKPGNV